jgi:hypothetical protein
MQTIFDPEQRAVLLRRLDALRPDQPAAWGRMNAPQMISHLICAFQAGLGELEVGPAVGPLSRLPLNWLAIFVLPWPPEKGVSPPEFLVRVPGDWAADVGILRTLIERSAERGPKGQWLESRAFGRISGRSWGALHRKHLDHHFRQFGG